MTHWRMRSAFNKINQSLADDILSEVMKLSPTAFEKMVLDLMAKMGYGTFANAATTTSITGDEGIDGIIFSVGRHPAWLLLPPSVGAHPSIAGAPRSRAAGARVFEAGGSSMTFASKSPLFFQASCFSAPK